MFEENEARNLSNHEVTHTFTDDNEPPKKKIKAQFSGKEFRKQLQSPQRAEALQNFMQLVREDKNSDLILTYLDKGGSPLEIMQVMETDPSVSPVLVFEIVNQILLQVNAKYTKYKNSAYDACRYLLNSYVTLINKMLGLSSSTKERTTVLKLLTTIVTFSTVLAKDVLLHVNFNPTNLELLTKVSLGKNDVRNAFLHFIIAFLIDGHFPTLSVLLEKRGLMTSIINGLKYDKADAVVLILTAMKNHILENAAVSKTIKMKTFSTPVVKDIVNLYNWKGPEGVPDPKKKTKIVAVDEVAKSKVNEAVHNFLLVLCTSHKFGVIFKDTTIGLSKKNYNSLMYTVLESLERPWEHSYAGELVIKICAACPDLTKTMWTNVKTFLEPRLTIKWLNAMNFVEKLLEEIKPDCIEFSIKELQVHQISQVIAILVLPLPVLKILIPENNSYESQAIKLRVMKLLIKMLNATDIFLSKVKEWGFDPYTVSTFLSNHIASNLLSAKSILCDWEKLDEQTSDDSNQTYSITDYLSVVLDLLHSYKKLSSHLLDGISPGFNVKEFLSKIDALENAENFKDVKLKAVKLFFELEPSLFGSKTELFQTAFILAFQFYFENKDLVSFELLNSLLTNCTIFDGYAAEIPIWINGIFNVKKYDAEIPLFVSNLVKLANQDASKLHRKLFELKKANFSPLILALSDHCQENDITKSVKLYLNFVLLNLLHLQTDSTSFRCSISNLNFLSGEFVTYVDNWGNFEITVLNKCKGSVLDYFREFSVMFLENQVQEIKSNPYPDFKLNLLQASMFYLTNLIKAQAVKKSHYNNCEKLIEILISHNCFDDERYVNTILGNQSILHNFTIFGSENQNTKFIISVVKNLESYKIENHLIDYRRKIVSGLVKAFKNPLVYESSDVSLDVFDIFGLDYAQCLKLINNFVDSEDNKSFFSIISYCLNKISELVKLDYSLEPLDCDVFKKLTKIFVRLIKEQVPNFHLFAAALLEYLKVFPHNVGDVETEVFENLISTTEFHKENLLLCEFLIERQPKIVNIFEQKLDEICSKRSFILTLLDVIIMQNNEELLKSVFDKFQSHIIKALQKPHKAGQQFQNYYKSVGFLIEKFMEPEGFGKHVQKFESTEFFHVYLLEKIFCKVEKTEKILGNMIMTFVHLLVNVLKQKSNSKSTEEFSAICNVFLDFLNKIENKPDLTFLSSNESFKLFSKFCLKYGIADDEILLKILTILVELCINEDDAKLILEMFLSHSLFLDKILGNNNKTEMLNLWLVLCSKFPQLMEKSHVPVLLSGYRATRMESDRITLTILKKYESKCEQTHFYEFKPFLWGRSAASYYSVRSDVQKVLWRQPKMGDVLENLHESTVQLTITDPDSAEAYDLDFLLPLFSHLLSPESPVQTYRFSKSGALALTITGLRAEKSCRLAACHVLSRFHFHLEARQTGKDNPLWIRFVEAICKGTAVLEDFKLNNFAAVYLARTALILTQPGHVMYVPLTQYLTAKDSPDFSSIPEIYTLLYSPDVNSKEHRHFILEVVRDGIKTEKDFTTFLKSMGYKLISELCSSSVSDVDTTNLVLEIFEKSCNCPLGVKVLCGNLSFLSQIFNMFIHFLQPQQKDFGRAINKLLEILLLIVNNDKDIHRNFVVYMNFYVVLENDSYYAVLKCNKSLDLYFRILMQIYRRCSSFLTNNIIERLLSLSKDHYSKYLVDYGCKFVREKDFDNSKNYYLHLLLFNKFKTEF